jgi:hypothetical protein
VGKEIFFRAFSVFIQGIVEDYLEVGDLVGGRYGRSVSVGHHGENKEFVHVKRRTAGSWKWGKPEPERSS